MGILGSSDMWGCLMRSLPTPQEILQVVGSNPAPSTNLRRRAAPLASPTRNGESTLQFGPGATEATFPRRT